MVSLRGASDINVSIKKATTAEATVPKRKHVRACVVYTWDNRNGRDFWNAIKLQPLQNSDVQTFKALAVIHKVMQEGHPKVIKEGQNNINWLRSLARNGNYGSSGQYGRLVEEYVRLLTHKLDFHKAHPAFNGTFEYEEYISLRQVDDPNEGYEAIIDLLNLQDAIDDFQRLIFGSLRGRHGNEVKIASLTAIVAESYGIYRFATSMLRGMYAAGQADEALEPLRQRYYTQHRRLRNFYFDCTTLKPLTALISIPQLPEEPPNLFLTDDNAPPLPRRPIEASKTGESSAPSLAPEPTGDWYLQQQAQQQQLEEQQRQQMLLQQQMAQQQQYEDEQRRLQAAREAEEARQRQLAFEQQQMFEQQQAQLLAQQQQAQEEFMRSQQQRNAEGRVAELEQQLFAMRGQQEEAQMMLQQYDQRVQALENELSQSNSLTEQQLQSKTDQVDALHEQVNIWKSKYESLAKLYSQLRQEHLDLLAKFKKTQAKAASAQEAIDKREKIERDLKAKNLELADLIRERDRARYDLDRVKGQHRDETDRLERDLSLLNDKLSKTQLSGSERASMLDSHSKEIQLLEAKLVDAQRLLANASASGDQDREIQYLKETIEAMEQELSKSVVSSGGSLLDEVLKSASESIKDGILLFHSPIETGNQGTTVQYIETIVQRCWESVDVFSTSFTDYLSAEAEGEGDAAPIVGATLNLSSGIVELLTNVKGVSAMLPDDSASEKVTQPTESAAEMTSEFFETMLSSVLSELTLDDQLELIIESHTDILQNLQQLLEAVMASQPKQTKETNPESAMERAALAAEEANRKLTELLARPRDPKLSVFDKHVHEAIIAAAVAITSAITALIKAASECQKEIVAKGRGTDSATVYYKKNHRWTQGLISASHAVADSTNTLIDTADGSLTGQNSPEQLIVASNEVAASTAQLVAAARVKADHGSRTQQNLEGASKSVGSACRSLVNRVQEILSSQEVKEKQTNYKTLPEHEFRTAAMAQQVEVLKFERQLTAARNRLFEIRREEYRRQGEDEDDEY